MNATILIVPDKFKGSMTSKEVSESIQKAINRISNDANIIAIPVSDGGDGFLETIVSKNPGASTIRFESITANGKPVLAPVLIDRENKSAFIESATVCGLEQVAPKERDPKRLTSHGLGVLIEKTMKLPDADIEQVYVGIGGTATVDGGFGLLTAMGARVFDFTGRLIRSPGISADTPYLHEHLDRIGKIELDPARVKIRKKLIILTDVVNPLTDAAIVFGPQKGASESDIIVLQNRLDNLANAVEKANNENHVSKKTPGTGAGGGISWALANLGGEIVSGSETILDLVDFDLFLKNAVLVITGEGRFDKTSLQGKITGEVIRRTQLAGKELLIFCGTSNVAEEGSYKIIQISNTDKPLTEQMKKAAFLLEKAAFEEMREMSRFFETDL